MNRPSLRIFSTALIFLLLTLAGAIPSAADQAAIAPLAEQSLLLDIEQFDNRLIAVGERGHILISDDSGGRWRQIQAPTRATLTGVFFLDRQQGWIVGHDQIILKTVDGGESWAQVYQDIEADSPLFDIYFLDSDHGFAVGAYGQFLETFDGGASWSGRWISEDDFHLNQIVPLGQKLFIAAEAGFIYRSDDQGANWTALTPGYEGSFFGVLPLAEEKLLLFGLRGNMFRSDDAGTSWTEIETATEASLTSGLVLSDGTVVITGLAGAILISADQGRNFSRLQDPNRKGFSALAQAMDGTIVAVGDFGVARITLDGHPENGGRAR